MAAFHGSGKLSLAIEEFIIDVSGIENRSGEDFRITELTISWPVDFLDLSREIIEEQVEGNSGDKVQTSEDCITGSGKDCEDVLEIITFWSQTEAKCELRSSTEGRLAFDAIGFLLPLYMHLLIADQREEVGDLLLIRSMKYACLHLR